MTRYPPWRDTLRQLRGILCTLLGDSIQLVRLCLRSSTALAAENLFLRKQLALYQERHVTPQRVTNATRLKTRNQPMRPPQRMAPARLVSRR